MSVDEVGGVCDMTLKKSGKLSTVLGAAWFASGIAFAFAAVVNNWIYSVTAVVLFAATLNAFLWTFPLTDAELGTSVWPQRN